jgi:uncharacterized protein (TIGR00251 family)
MKITVRVVPNSFKDEIFYSDVEKMYTVKTRKAAIEGEANKKVIQILSEYFKIPKSQVRLFSGQKSRFKIFEIEI